MWITIESAEIDIRLDGIKLVGATLEGDDLKSPVREVRISFEWGSHHIRLRGPAAQQLWDQVLDWNKHNTDSPVPLVWHGPPTSNPIQGGLMLG